MHWRIHLLSMSTCTASPRVRKDLAMLCPRYVHRPTLLNPSLMDAGRR